MVRALSLHHVNLTVMFLVVRVSNMAANVGSSLKWQELLPEHPVFQRISQGDDDARSGITEESRQRTTNNILIENDGEIFLWDSSKISILTANLKNLHFENERSNKFQEFDFTEPPLFAVDSMLFSPSSKYLLLIGERGISVLEMPMRWGKFAEYDGGSKSVLCRTIPIDPRFYVTHYKINVLDVKWHPGSQADIQLMVLTSDNNLRLYNVLKPTSPEEIISLGESSSLTAEYSRKSLSVGSMSSFAAALGEKAIAFDFAPATAALVLRERLNSSDAAPQVTHPIFILRENGDIYYLVHRISQMRCQPQLTGPLTMYPAADDNYGLDACSLLCLHSQPPVIAIATASGKIYHCIALESEESYDPEEEIQSWNRHGTVKSDSCQQNLSLFVHECVELQVSLLNEAADRSSTEDYSEDNENLSLLRLQRDPGSPYQYHCLHNTGVHSVSLPWAKKLQSYCLQGGEGSFDPDEAAIVYHMICTSPTAASSSSQILGVCVVDSRILGTSMLCLTSKMECIIKPLSSLNRPPSPSTTETDEETSYESSAFSPIRHLNVGLFKSQIEKILTRNTSTPLLRAGEESEKLSQEDCYQLLIQAQEILRKEYIQKQNEAREEIEKRISILKDQKEQQNQLLEKLHRISDELKEQAVALGEKLDNTSGKHLELLRRLESLFRYVHNGTPVLSHAESKMKKELEDIKTFLQFHRESLEQIKAKNKYSKKSPRTSTSSKLLVVNVSQQNNIRQVLSEESEVITNLVNQVKELKIQVGL